MKKKLKNKDEGDKSPIIVLKKEDLFVPSKKDRTSNWIMIILMVATLVATITMTSWGQVIINSFDKPQYEINLLNGNQFNEGNISKISNQNYISINQEIYPKVNANDIAFNFKVENIGQNSIKDYSVYIVIIDPLNNIRGNDTFSNLINNKDFMIKFNFPPKNERLYGEWKIYSEIRRDNNIYSKYLLPFKVEQPQNDTIYYIIFSIGAIIWIVIIFWGKIKKIFKREK